MDRTIGTMLAIITILLLLAIDAGIRKDKLEKDFDVYKKMTKKMCWCHPWKE
jgi:hypothetical protein